MLAGEHQYSLEKLQCIVNVSLTQIYGFFLGFLFTANCYYNGTYYKHGESISPRVCVTCTCNVSPLLRYSTISISVQDTQIHVTLWQWERGHSI